jgi:hypothetical protein
LSVALSTVNCDVVPVVLTVLLVVVEDDAFACPFFEFSPASAAVRAPKTKTSAVIAVLEFRMTPPPRTLVEQEKDQPGRFDWAATANLPY